MLKLEMKQRNYLKEQGFLDSTIDTQLYRTISKSYIKRRLTGNILKRKYDLAGIPGFYQEDFGWTFINEKGFFIPIFDENNKIQGLAIHLDDKFNATNDILFSSKDKINGTAAKSFISKNNITENTNTIVLTDNLIKDTINVPTIAFSNITNSYQILNILDNTNIKNIIFTIRKMEINI